MRTSGIPVFEYMEVLRFISGSISLIGFGQGILLAFIFFFAKKTRADKFMAGFIFTYSIEFFNNYLRSTESFADFPELLYLPINFFYAYMPLLYLYQSALIDKRFDMGLRHWTILLPAILELYIFSILFLYHPDEKMHWHNSDWGQRWFWYYRAGGMFFSLGIALMVLFKLKKYHENVVHEFSSLNGVLLNWLKLMTVMISILLTAWIVQLILENQGSSLPGIGTFYWFGQMVNVGMIFWIGYYGMRQPIILSHVALNPTPVKTHLDKEEQLKLEHLYQTILQYINNEKPYLDPTLRLSDLVEAVEAPELVVSRAINECAGVNFYNFINNFRLEEFKRLVKKDKRAVYSLLGLAYEAGFNSKSTFNAYFKKKEGITPSQFAVKARNAVEDGS
ncbi:helix-turn-helix domain-containing protein [Fulvivirgaceae bacterium BMA10]|uniref:Helix-turn-helix domain-containing protein n=1 Tax=Splendidivirga corallicola TaxID=3051826 RepID=A0ABT8KNM5_9BACT|nr:helix-turn-helix domain-containing protein [Fulvivirgaceae bacterium BMA10]